MTPVQIPFKRNFKDMENKFEYLKIDGREQLPAPWVDFNFNKKRSRVQSSLCIRERFKP